MQIRYKGYEIGTRRIDFFVEDETRIEIKAIINLEDVHLAQPKNYPKAYNMKVGLLLTLATKTSGLSV